MVRKMDGAYLAGHIPKAKDIHTCVVTNHVLSIGGILDFPAFSTGISKIL
jgi:hypothetical protein